MAGDVRAASRLIRHPRQYSWNQRRLLSIFPLTGNAHVVGITGSPGAGKSTLADELIVAMRKENKTVECWPSTPRARLEGGSSRRPDLDASTCRGSRRVR